ncbi:MAG: ABC transporter permease [Verrucomicrobiae bacterium]|nr:ABC transporter permease [Verrucomicrobiae bacterium]
MRFNRTAAVVLRQIYLLRGSPARVLPIFAWVTIDIVLWGFLTKYLNASTATSLNFVPMLLGAVLMWDFFTRVMHGTATAFLEDVWSRNFLNFFASPLSISEYLAGLVLTSILTSFVALVFMLLFATAAFGLSLFAYGSMLIPFLMVLFLFGIALGIAGTAMVLRLGPASEWFIWPIPALFSPFAAVFYPVSVLPAWMRLISRFLPPSYVFEGMRAIVAGKSASMSELLFAGGLAAVDILLAAWFFTGVYRRAVRTGLIARYSAESVS